MGNYCNAFGTLVADVEVDTTTGKVRVTQLTSVVDPGLIINPRGAETTIAQAELFALSRTLHEEVKFDTKQMLSQDWVTYPILRFADAPEQKTVLINRPEYSPGGIGEGPEILVPAAVANAIYDATGVRMRVVPFTPARVRAALKGSGIK
jgi:CO/xanthine dehydrogenase Mo-binding subunit